MNLKEFLDVELPSDTILSRRPPSIDAIAAKYRKKANIKKAWGRSIESANIKVGDIVKLKEGDGTIKDYKVLRIIYSNNKPAYAVVALPGGLDKRIVRIKGEQK